MRNAMFTTLLIFAFACPLTITADGVDAKDLGGTSKTVSADDKAMQAAFSRLRGDINQLSKVGSVGKLTSGDINALRKHAANVRRDARIVSDYARKNGNSRAADLADRIIIDDDVTGKLIINDDITGRKAEIAKQIEVLNALTAELEKSGFTKRK